MIIATNNKDKLKELKTILNEYELYSLRDKNINIEIEEDQDTFYGNALKKAKTIYELTNEAVIADDSGLCINALNDFPGVFTSRFLGDSVTDEKRNQDLINRLNGIADRSARVICNLVYYDGENIITGVGILAGIITLEPRGENGFGFDPIFELEDGRTLAEITSDEKNKLSARYLAAIDLKNKLNKRMVL